MYVGSFLSSYVLFWLPVWAYNLPKNIWITECWLHCVSTKEYGTVGAKRKVKVTHLEVGPGLHHHHFFKEKLGHGNTFDPSWFQNIKTIVYSPIRYASFRNRTPIGCFYEIKIYWFFSHTGWLGQCHCHTRINF